MEGIVGIPVEPEFRDVHFDLIRVAKPSTPDIPFQGPPNAVPFLPGLLFPYFSGCLNPSYTAVHSVIKRYFLSSLGQDITECTDRIRLIRRASSSWAMSPGGLELQHLAAGIQLAIETGARLFIIQEDENYLGYALLGYGFKVVAADGLVEAISAERLKEEIGKMESKSKLTAELVDVVMDLAKACEDISDAEVEKIPSVEVCAKSLRPLRTWIQKNYEILDETDESRKVIIDLMRKCYQSQPFLRVNENTICTALSQIINGHPIEPLSPFFVTDQVFTDWSDVHDVMAQFGSTAFSFIHAGGTDYPIPRKGEKDIADEMVSVPAGKGKVRSAKAMSSIFTALKPMRSCVGDFQKMMKDRKVSMRVERAGAQRNIRFDGEKRDKIWEALCSGFQQWDDRSAVNRSVGDGKGKAKDVEFHKGPKRALPDDF